MVFALFEPLAQLGGVFRCPVNGTTHDARVSTRQVKQIIIAMTNSNARDTSRRVHLATTQQDRMANLGPVCRGQPPPMLLASRDPLAPPHQRPSNSRSPCQLAQDFVVTDTFLASAVSENNNSNSNSNSNSHSHSNRINRLTD